VHVGCTGGAQFLDPYLSVFEYVMQYCDDLGVFPSNALHNPQWVLDVRGEAVQVQLPVVGTRGNLNSLDKRKNSSQSALQARRIRRMLVRLLVSPSCVSQFVQRPLGPAYFLDNASWRS
jgi:hypothetical protein